MGFTLNRLLPTEPHARRRLNWRDWIFVVVAGISTIRSSIHMLAPDGGAMSIAGINVELAGGTNIIAIFAQWGASQLVLALIYWVVIVRYRALISLMWMIILAEQLLRIITGHLKPIATDVPPPGAYGTYILLAVSSLVLAFSLWDRGDKPMHDGKADA
jgi:hypothetical protein